MRLLFLLMASVLLFGCLTTTDRLTNSAKVQQLYFAELSAYYVLLNTAGEYKDRCFAKPEYLQQDCREVVRNLRDIAIRVEEIRDLTDRAIEVNSGGSILIATGKLRDLKAGIEALTKEGLNPPVQPPGQPVPP